ncbi:MAG TPA: hypothetical protein VK761_05095 [Solirubrobacteraceae bacterium]|nr:hypothetical protein [Solirubrobacteraceae bacterium]
MSERDFGEVLVLGDYRQPVLDRCRGDQRVGQLDCALDSGAPTIRDQPRPAQHDGLADRDWIGRLGQGECVRASRASPIIARSHHAKLQLSDRDYRHRNALG